MLVDVEATLEEVNALSSAVLGSFREMRLITGEANDDCVLGGEGYRPGPALSSLYVLGQHELPFWTLITSGVERRVGRHFNEWALGPVCEGLTCPACGADFKTFGDACNATNIGASIGEWFHQSGPALVRCPKCDKSRCVTEWQCKPPLGFGNLSFSFWNWPPLDSAAWKIDIKRLVEGITGHKLVSTYGHI
jgi:hypothetical protein